MEREAVDGEQISVEVDGKNYVGRMVVISPGIMTVSSVVYGTRSAQIGG